MKFVLLCFLLAGALAPGAQSEPRHPLDYVNALVGTAPLDDPQLIGNAPPPGEEIYTGFTSPGAALPHGITSLSPVNKDLSTAADGHGIVYPYIYQRRTMVGFSTMVPGMLVMPLVGDWTVPPDRGYASVYDKQTEKATPGYYSVFFPDHKVQAEMTVTRWTGMFRFTFPKSDRARVLMDLGPGDALVEIVGDRTIRGRSRSGRGQRGNQFFILECSRPFSSFGTFRQNNPTVNGAGVRRGDTISPDSRSESAGYAGAYLNFTTAEHERVLFKVASGDSFETAQKRLADEEPGWDFDAIKLQAEAAWSRKLDTIEVKGGTEKERMLFYSCLYHVFSSPRLVARKGEPLGGRGGQGRIAEYDRYGNVPFWDTGRNQIVLLTLLEPEVKENILSSHLDMARETGWMHTSFHGDHAILMYLGDWQRGLNFDWPGVYEYLRKNAMDPAGPRPRLAEYMQQGWVHDIVVEHPSPPYANGNAGVAKTLEYCWDDFCLATYAKKLGKEDGLPHVPRAGLQLYERFRPRHRVHAWPQTGWLVDRTLRPPRALLQLHVQRGLRLPNHLAGPARRCRLDPFDGWTRKVCAAPR
jgi:predicted alpha-1,2-mannosidase